MRTYDAPQIFRDSMIKLLHGVSSVKHLYLSGHLEALNYCGEYKLPTFNNLSCLYLDLSGPCENWRHFLPAFLHSSPMLENLVFPGGLSLHKSNYNYDYNSFWSDLETLPSCVSSHLKTITIASFHGQVNEELNITKYFLRYGKVLTKLILCCKLKSKKEYTEIKKLFKIGRLASKECSLDLVVE